MCVHYIEVEIELDKPTDLCTQVEQALETRGEPLRWAIVEAAGPAGPVRVEATILAR